MRRKKKHFENGNQYIPKRIDDGYVESPLLRKLIDDELLFFSFFFSLIVNNVERA